MIPRGIPAVLTLACALVPGTALFASPPDQQAPGRTEAPLQMPADARSQPSEQGQTVQQPREPIPPLTDADRAAAFPPHLQGHATHDGNFNYFVLFDQLEWQGSRGGGVSFENTTWVGGDVNRLWLRADGDSEEGRIENARVHGLWGHSFSRWWDVVAGVRQDLRPGDAQTWVAFGLQGLAPYWFEIEATGYVGGGGRTQAVFEVEYDVLLTNRLILQPLVEVEMYGKSDRARGIGAGLSSIETGVRLRYEFRRELSPYVGITWDRKLFGTADLARADGHEVGAARVAFGMRTWF